MGPFLCSEHFLPTDFSRTFSSIPGFDTKNTKTFLRRDAVPSVRKPKQDEELSKREKRMVSNVLAIVLVIACQVAIV